MTTETITLAGEKGEKMTLPPGVFGVKADKRLLATAVRVWRANQRKANAKTKTRGEVAKTTAKMYRQKGTGKARHGSFSAPIFVGGGIAHGPDGWQNYKLKMTTAVKRLALAEALSDKATDKNVVVVTGADKASGKTKQMAALVKKAGWNGKILVVGTAAQTAWVRGWKNVPQTTIRLVEQINTYLVVANKQLVVTAEAIAEMEKKYVN